MRLIEPFAEVVNVLVAVVVWLSCLISTLQLHPLQTSQAAHN